MRTTVRLRLVAAVVVAGVAFGTAACARPKPTGATMVPKTMLRYLPKETAGVAVIEAARLEDRAALTRWLRESLGEATRDPGTASIMAVLGSEFFEQIDRAAVALVPASGSVPATSPPPAPGAEAARPGTPPPGWVILFEGRFDEKMLKSIGPPGTIVTLVEVSNGPWLRLLALPDKGLAIGPGETLAKVQEVLQHPDAGLGRSGLMTPLGKVAGDAQAWGAMDYSPLAALTAAATRDSGSGGNSFGLPMLAARASTLKSVAFEARVAQSVDFTVIGSTGDEKGAKDLGDAARGLIALMRMAAGQGPDKTWYEFLDGLRIGDEKTDVRVTGTLSRPMVAAIVARGTAAGLPVAGGGATSGATPNAAPAPTADAPAARP